MPPSEQWGYSARLLKILPARLGHINEGRSLAAANALLLPGDADGAAAYAYLDKVRAAVCKEPEALSVHDVARADLYLIAVFAADPGECPLLPFRKAL
jgi:hypothetical protein